MVTHPFHPWRGRAFELWAERYSWGRHWLLSRDEDGREVSVDVRWTNRAEIDAYVAVSAGRSTFRFEDLLRLATLVSDLSGSPTKDAKDADRKKMRFV